MNQSTENQDTHNSLSWKIVIDITVAILALKIGRRQPPTTRIWISGRDVCRYGISRKEINIYEVTGPFHCVHATSVVIEGCSVTTVLANNGAADITSAVSAALV